jgi:multisubunit Na+/H+ antiporter MnhB subunit
VTVGEAFDIVLCLLIVAVALGAILGRDLFGAVAQYVVYGLLLAIAWVRLGAVDVGLAEGAIGAGLTGVLLLGAAGRLEDPTPRPIDVRILPILLPMALTAGLAWAVIGLAGKAQVGLNPLVADNLALSGADNPVTAVLLNFRGWDTLLESVVLLIALIGVWSLAPDRLWGGRPGLVQRVRPEGVLATFGRFLPPVGLVVGVYVVWAGTSAPGGAFQAGTVLAAVWLLAMMTATSEPPPVSRMWLRWALVVGPLMFLGVGLYGFAAGAFLAFAPDQAKPLILAIELALALSIAVTLALLVMGPPRRPR